MVGVAKRVRTIDGIPTMNVSITPPTATIKRDPSEPKIVAGDGSVQVPRADDEQDDADPCPCSGDTDLHVDREGEHRQHSSDHGHRSCRAAR